MGKIAKDKRDIYYRLAKENSYRSRSAFKLKQIDQRFNLLDKCYNVVDLCAAPGGWTQIVSENLSKNNKEKTNIISVDLQKFDEIKRVTQVIGDITKNETLEKILKNTQNSKVDLVLSDCAPDISGLNEFDSYIQFQLVLASLNISIRLLAESGCFIGKIFRGKHLSKMIFIAKKIFKKVKNIILKLGYNC
jgi:cell division protein FtsJ